MRLSVVSYLTAFLFIGASSFLYGQNSSVKGKRVFTCTSDATDVKVDSFPTPEGAVNHYITKHMPSGFKLKAGTIEVLGNGWVVFTTHKNGQQEASQGGHVLGRVICPPDSWETYGDGTNFESKTCECNQGYVAYGDSCKRPEDIPLTEEQPEEPATEPEDECAKKSPLTPAQQKLKEKAITRLKEIVDEQNKLLANDLTRAGGKGILTKSELNHYGDKFFAGYGHALERLSAQAVAKDPFLKTVLHYNTNTEQRAAGGGPDFVGKGKLPATVEFDITTPKEAAQKVKKDDKKCYEFITYDRLTDKQGNVLDQ